MTDWEITTQSFHYLKKRPRWLTIESSIEKSFSLLLVLGNELRAVLEYGKGSGSGKELDWSKKSSSTSPYFQLLS